MLIGSYQTFAYNKSTIKLFYSYGDEDVNSILNANGDDELTEDRRDVNFKMRKQLTRGGTSNFSMSFFMYQILWVLSTMCCCFMKCCGCEKEGSWCSKQLLRKKRLELAIEKV